MAKKPTAAAQHHCGRCGGAFNTRQALQQHLTDHPDARPAAVTCAVCKRSFDDSLNLEKHVLVHGHSQTVQCLPQHKCDRCSQAFASKREYNNHRKLGQPCCDAHHSKNWRKTSRPAFADLDKPKVVFREVHELEYGEDPSDTPSDMSEGQEYCHYCKKIFASAFAYTRHLLGCTASNNKLILDSTADTLPVSEQEEPVLHKESKLEHPKKIAQLHTTRMDPTQASSPPTTQLASAQAPALVIQPASISPTIDTGNLVCKIANCKRIYKTEAGLKLHQADTHGVGGQVLDVFGRNSSILSQKERERLKAQRLLRNPPSSFRGASDGHGVDRGGRAAPPSSACYTAPLPAPFAPPVAARSTQFQPFHSTKIDASSASQAGQNVGGPLDMEEAKAVCGKMLRLLLQTDILLGHYGKISVSGIEWTRVGVERQPTVIGLFDEMCHLPRSLQSVEYLPAPKTFLAEYTTPYAVADFESAPPHNPAKPGLGIVAIACSKIQLSDRCNEIVKIAAVDVLTCRILMNHLVCTDACASVTNWNSPTTGLTSYKDIEDARQAGYKVLKGWHAARAALFSFIDKDTIIVGHNLRSELDALRVFHGRAVDIVKMVEKAAKGPLSKAQVSLDSWCRDVADVATLPTDPVYGRDCISNAFAAREIGLWAIKNREKFEKVARQKTKDFQSITKT